MKATLRLYRWEDHDRADFELLETTFQSLPGSCESRLKLRGPQAASLLERAKVLYDQRRKRDRKFGDDADIFADPAWDILLDLLVARLENRSVSITNACIAACVSQTTALRWLNTLEARRLIVRSADAEDARRSFVALTPEAAELVAGALDNF